MNEHSTRHVLADPVENVTAIVKRSGTSFYWAMRLLPPHKRQAMYAVYAFCREVDDIADGLDAPAQKLRALDEWQAEIDRLYAGSPTHSIARALAEPVSSFALAKVDFEAILAGMRMDAVERLRIADSAELALYCDRVACAVGRLSCMIFGVPAAEGSKLATALGEALQLTNILRDIQEDALRDRIYLPADLLREHGIGEIDPDTFATRPELAKICPVIADRAESRFEEADRIMRGCVRSAIRPAAVMKAVYYDVLRALQARGWARLTEPVRQSRLRKCRLIAGSLLAP
jgi:presqualene diphosphate synthase